MNGLMIDDTRALCFLNSGDFFGKLFTPSTEELRTLARSIYDSWAFLHKEVDFDVNEAAARIDREDQARR